MKKNLTLFILIGLLVGFTACSSDDHKTYTITFNANGGSGTMADQTVTENTTVTLSANLFIPAQEGYRFAGWNTNADGSGTDYANVAQFQMGTANVTLYAMWEEIPTYTITFDPDDGEGIMEPQSLREGSTTALRMNAFTKENYRFIGWAYTAGGAVEYANGAAFTMGTTGSFTLFAVWELIPTYTISFDANGGTGTMAPLTGVQENTSVTLPSNTLTPPTEHVFLKWNTKADESGTDYADGAQFPMGEEDITLYAIWLDETVPTHRIIFNANGGTGTMADTVVQENTPVPLPSNGFTAQEGYRFVNWNTLANGSGTSYTVGAPFTMGTADVTLYAIWELIPTYTITFHANAADATGTMAPLTGVRENTSVTLPVNAFSRGTGYTFEGWAVSAGGAMVHVNGATIQVQNSNIDLYAVWATVLTVVNVIFNLDGGIHNGNTVIPPQQVVVGSTAIRPFPDPTKEDYRFVHWYRTNPEISFSFNTSLTEDTTLTALWERVYTLTFDHTGGVRVPGTMPAYVQVRYGETLPTVHTVSPPAVRIGFSLVGYSDAIDGGIMYFEAIPTYGVDDWYITGREERVTIWDKEENATLYAQWLPCLCAPEITEPNDGYCIGHCWRRPD